MFMILATFWRHERCDKLSADLKCTFVEVVYNLFNSGLVWESLDAFKKNKRSSRIKNMVY